MCCSDTLYVIGAFKCVLKPFFFCYITVKELMKNKISALVCVVTQGFFPSWSETSSLNLFVAQMQHLVPQSCWMDGRAGRPLSRTRRHATPLRGFPPPLERLFTNLKPKVVLDTTLLTGQSFRMI